MVQATAMEDKVVITVATARVATETMAMVADQEDMAATAADTEGTVAAEMDTVDMTILQIITHMEAEVDTAGDMVRL